MSKTLKIFTFASILLLTITQSAFAIELDSNSSIWQSISKEKIDTTHEYFFGVDYPNPFGPSNSFIFTIPVKENVNIILYDTNKINKYIILDLDLEKGSYRVFWDASKVNAGIYRCEFKTSNYFDWKKFVLVK